MKREGPGFLRWLWGRAVYPPSRARCPECGQPGGGGNETAGLGGVSKLAALCTPCRRAARDRLLKGGTR